MAELTKENASENLLTAMEVIAQSVVDGVAFDKTITCTIVDDSDKENGRYRVTDGSSKFIAYSETKTFRNNEIVYVTIPNGDFGEQKVIIGKKAEVEEEPFNYIQPFDNFLPCTENILTDSPKGSLIANENNSEETFIKLNTQNISVYKNFTRLGIKANFQSLLSKEQIKSGEYGLKITISAITKDKDESSEFVYTLVPKEALLNIKEELLYIYNDIDEVYVQAPSGYRNIYPDLNFFVQGSEVKQNDQGNWVVQDLTEAKKKEIFTLFLNTQDILGNPYSFEVPSAQQKVFDISRFDYIEEMVVYFYQKNDFYKKNGEKLSPNQFANLFVENIQVMFGFDLSEIDGEFLQLFTFDSMNYQHSEDNSENIKHIELRWAHKDGDKLSVFNKDNMEDWYDTIYDNEEQESKPYEFTIDNSPQQVNKRQYYELNKNADIVKDGYNMIYNCGSKGNSDSCFELESFSPTSKYNQKELFFKKQLITKAELENNKYFTMLAGKDNDIEEVIKPYLYGQGMVNINKEPLPLSERKNFNKYTIYEEADNKYSIASILSENDFELGKIYWYDKITDKDEDNKKLTYENAEYFYIYCPIKNSVTESDLSLELGTWQIFKPNFQKTDNSENVLYYFIDTDNLVEVQNNFKYESGQYYYKKFNLDNITINWYRYKVGAPAADKYSGIYWEKIDVCEEGKETTCIEATDSLPFECTLIPDSIHNKTEQIKVILILDGIDGEQVYYSNILTFENKSDVISIPTTQQEYALRLQIDDNTQGNYLLYDENNGIIDNEQSTRTRSVTVLFDKADFNSKALLKDATKVTWIFPIENTMLKVNYNMMNGQYSADGAYATVITESANEEYKLYYTIENNFTFNKNNNTITCTVEKDGEIFSTTQEFTFGQNGSNGSDYTLVLDLLTSDNMITLNPTNNLIGFRHIDQEQEKYDKDKSYYIYNDLLKQYEIMTDLTEEEYQKYVNELFIKVQSETALYKALAKLDEIVYEQKLNNWLEYYDIIQSINEDATLNKTTKLEKIEQAYKEYYDQEYQNYYVEQRKQTLEDLKKAKEAFDEEIKKYPNKQRIENLKTVLEDLQVQQNLLEDYSYLKDDHFIKIDTTTPIEDNKIRATLYDQSGHQINNGEYTITWSWFITPEDNQLFGEIISDNILLNGQNEAYIPLIKAKPNNNDMSQLWIAQATVTGFGDYDLTAYLPIPLRWDYGVTRYQGPTQIIYSTTGVPNYYKDEINLFYNDIDGKEQQWTPRTGFEIITTTENEKEKQYQPILVYDSKYYTKTKKYITAKEIQNEEEEKISYDDIIDENNNYFIKKETESEPKRKYWAVGIKIYYDEEDTGIQKEINLASTDNINELTLSISKKDFPEDFYYIIVETNSENTTNPISVSIQPKAIYVDCAPFGISYTYNNIIEFTQPILNIQNRYFSSTINKWDGSLQVDNEQNTILAKMIGAGRKNQDNTFSGVVMGDWTGNVNANDGGTISLRDKPGLYGFHKGETSFGFTSEGIGFIGKAGRGRILLDGNNSVITSANWVMNSNMDNMSNINSSAKDNQGLYMKIDDGFILMRDKGSHYIKLDALASGDIDEDKVRTNSPSKYPAPGGNVDNPQFPFVIYGDTNNFTQIGWNGNLFMRGEKPSEETSSDGSSSEKKSSGYIYLNASASKYPLDINSHFAVGWDGSLTISKYDIHNKFSEQATQIIQKDDQRTTGDGDSSVTKVTGVDKSLNQYDYTVLQPYRDFHGLYATPDGDMYLSRKLVIGSKFSATADGYLRAKSALFDDCNANVFQVRYLPSTGANANINFKESAVPAYNDQTTSELSTECYGAKIGSMGWLKGARDIEEKDEDGNIIKDEDGNIKTKTVGTYNLGFKSEKHCGILLDSTTNIRITSGTQKDGGNFGTYFTGKKLEARMDEELNLFQLGNNSNNNWIHIGSNSLISSRAKDRIRFAIEPNSDAASTVWDQVDKVFSTNADGTTISDYVYNTAFALDRKGIFFKTKNTTELNLHGSDADLNPYELKIKSNQTGEDGSIKEVEEGSFIITKSYEYNGNNFLKYNFQTREMPNAQISFTVSSKDEKSGASLPKSSLILNGVSNSSLTAGKALILESQTNNRPIITLGYQEIPEETVKGETSIRLQAPEKKIRVEAGQIAFTTPSPNDQTGIYARFA